MQAGEAALTKARAQVSAELESLTSTLRGADLRLSAP
jgi:hypothetical protein